MRMAGMKTDDLIDVYVRHLDVRARVDRFRADFELTKVSAAGHGFVLSSAEDEMDRLEHGKVNCWDPTDNTLGTSWLYKGSALPEVNNRDRVRLG